MNSIAIGGVRGWLGLTLEAVLRGAAAHGLLYFLALMVLTLAVAESVWLAVPFDFSMMYLFNVPIALVLGATIVGDLGVQLVRFARQGGKGSVSMHLLHHVRTRQMAPERVANAFHVVAFFIILMTGNIYMREAIPHANPYAWDKAFAEWDRILHFGAYPHEWLAPLLNWPMVTTALAYAYSFWFFVMFGMWLWQGFRKEQTQLRMQFLLAFGVAWFIGCNVLGTLLSSVGPCFYGRLLGAADPYGPLMDYLRSVGGTSVLGIVNTQNLLWDFYATGEGSIRGITAMPSMHVATSVLFAILGFASGKRWLGWLLTIFAALIMIGSVQLGWHYAIDGYVGAAIAFLSWWSAGMLVAWDFRRRGAV